MSNTRFDRLVAKLRELFQLDQPELDFGIYRILHARSEEITAFLENDLLPQVKDALATYQPADKAALQAELDEAIAQATSLGADPESLPKVRDLRNRLENEAVDLGALEADVYDHLYRFFARYYNEGDFISLRRYKEGVYAIPYEGEEVKLHWANHDQYYIKTAEYLRDYAFRLRPDDAADPMRVHFRLLDAAEGEHGNVKEAEGKKRVFVLAASDFIAEEPGESGAPELVLQFEYRPATVADWPDAVREGKDKPPTQKDLLDVAVERILALDDPSLAQWISALADKHTKADGSRAEYSRLRAHLDRYSARNTFDYFIHKDLGGFLRRELDFYIKSEVMRLDDIDDETAPRVEQYLSKIKVIRRIALKIVDFLAQLEDFQKKLWLKRKFVTETRYCITLGTVPESLYPEIADSTAQRDEWISLLGIDKCQPRLDDPGYTVPLQVDFLKAHPELPLDTRYFSPAFCERLLDSIDDYHEQVGGVMFHAEAAQAIHLAERSLGRDVSTIYIDPPFNLGDNADYLYRTDYADATWLTLLSERLGAASAHLADDGLLFVRCDYHGAGLVRQMLSELGFIFRAEILIDRSRNEAGSPNKLEATYEHLFMASRSEMPIRKFTVPRSVANIKWTGFLMAGDRNPPERVFLGKTIRPPAGQHYSLVQPKVEKLLDDFYLRLRCAKCGTLYFRAEDDGALAVKMKSKKHRFKFYDVTTATLLHGVRSLQTCVECGHDDFRVDYLGSEDVFVSDNWLDIPSYSRRWGFQTENSEELIHRVLRFTDGIVIDFFAGSATTAAVAQKMGRPWIVSDMASHFVDVAIPRMKQVIAGDSGGISADVAHKPGGLFKIVHLESYEDALNNLELKRTGAQQSLLDSPAAQGVGGLKEQYLLGYMLDVESRGGASLLNVEQFTDPRAYTLKVKQPGSDETREVMVDLLETFNWLLGLRVHHIATPQSFSATFKRDDEGRLKLDGRLKIAADGGWWFRTVQGDAPDGRKVLVIWRTRPGGDDAEGIEQDNLVLDEWFTRQGYSAKDSEFDLIYVNGDNNLENLKDVDDRWKVRLIEEEFFRLMFDVEDV